MLRGQKFNMQGRKFLKLISCFLLGFGIFLPAVVNATAVRKLSDEDLANQAETIITGKCISIKSEWNDERTKIFTYITIAPQNLLKGDRMPRSITIKQPGGEVGDIGMRVDGVSVFEEGEDVLLFLERDQRDSYRTLGLSQGKFAITTDQGTGRKVLVKKRAELVRTKGGKLEKRIIEIRSEKRIFLDDFTAKIRDTLKRIGK
jgi:hypothetical protein